VRDLRADAGTERRSRWRVGQALALLLGALFLASVAQFYHPGLGFTALIVFPGGDTYEIPALRELPHYRYPEHVAYDGAFYAQLAMEPLLKDPAIDQALDLPAYRARRILFSWTAWLAGLGKPAWILQAYALQNVVVWIVMAWLLTRWLPLDGMRTFLLWAAAMFSHGLLASVRMALIDGPSLLLLTVAVLAAERGRLWAASGVLAVSGLGRETNLLGGAALPWPRGWRGALRVAGACALALVPLLVWQDYVWSIYRDASAGAGHITTPLGAYLTTWDVTVRTIGRDGFFTPAGSAVLVLVALTVQAVFVVVTARWWREPWWRLAAVFAVLMCVVHVAVWEGWPGAITRVVLPLTFGFNILLARWRGRGFWAWYVLGNLHVVAGLHTMPIPWLPVLF
jgi:hypothetical protein